MLTACELASITADLTAALPSTCTIQRATKTSDGKGGRTTVWATLATAVACNVEAVKTRQTDREESAAERVAVAVQFLITLPLGQDVTEKDRIVALNRTFEVTTVQGPESLAPELRVLAVEVR